MGREFGEAAGAEPCFTGQLRLGDGGLGIGSVGVSLEGASARNAVGGRSSTHLNNVQDCLFLARVEAVRDCTAPRCQARKRTSSVMTVERTVPDAAAPITVADRCAGVDGVAARALDTLTNDRFESV